ncbi:MAG: transporter [Candidatus Latescibacterota bacterium]
MKKTIMLTFVSIVGAFLFSTTAMAFDDLYTQDTAAVTKAGGIDVGGKILYKFGKKYYNKDSESADAPDSGSLIHVPLFARYGIMDKLEAFAVLPIVSISKIYYQDTLLPDKSGIGDIWLGAKYAVMPDNFLTIRGALDLPTGTDKDGLGNPGGFGIDVAAMTAKQMDKLGFNGQVGIRWNAEGPDDAGCEKPGLGIYVTAEGSYTLAEKLDGIFGIEYGMAGDSEFNGVEVKDSGQNLFTLNIGAKYMAMETVGVRGDVLIPLAGKHEFAGIGILVGLFINVQ